ncbi:MAG TPA: hypothetical protein PKK06_11920 [Phycisphaerae bacterium]|nr:hypothetical protein [Phycisphaerae bacterium]HNU46000.1 hypothetical protein [Phycisphaerae bacterium]
MRHRFDNLFRADAVVLSMGVHSAATLAQRGLGLARGVVLAWLISKEQYGLFGLALLVVNVLLPVCTGGLYEGVARFAPLHEARGTLKSFTVRVGVRLTLLTVGIGLLLWLAAGALGPVLFSAAGQASGTASPLSLPSPPRGRGVSPETVGLLRAVLICVITLAPYQTLLGMLKGLRMFRAVSVVELLATILFTALALGLPLLGWRDAQTLVWSYTASNVVAVVVFVPGLLRRLPLLRVRAAAPLPSREGLGEGGVAGASPLTLPSPLRGEGAKDAASRLTPPSPLRGNRAEGAPGDQGLARPGQLGGRLMTYSLWLAATALLWNALSYYPVWHLLRATDAAVVGTFHAIRTMTQLIQIGAVVLSTVAAAHVTATWEQRGRPASLERLDLLTGVSLVALLAGAAALSVARPVLMHVLPRSFALGAAAYDPLLLFFVIVGVLGLLAIRFNLVQKPHWTCAAWLIGMVVSVGAAHVLLGPPGGGAAPADGGRVVDAADALGRAAWASVAGVAAAAGGLVVLLLCLRLALPVRTLGLVAATLAVGWGWVPACVALLAVVMLGLCGWLFTPTERAELVAVARRLWGR